MKRIVITCLSGLLSLAMAYSQGYQISLEAPDFPRNEVILVEYFTSKMIPKDTVMLDGSGRGTFTGDSLLEGGLYLMYFDQQHFFDFLIGDDQVMEISADSSDFVREVEFNGSEENRLFFGYKEFISDNRSEIEDLNNLLQQAGSGRDSVRIRTQIDERAEAMKEYAENIISAHPDLFVSAFLRAMKDVELPEEIRDLEGEDKQARQYAYYKTHYFDNFDISNVRLLHTPLYEPKIKNYINKVIVQHPDSLIKAVDFLVEKSRAHPSIFRYMLITLFNNFAESKLMGMDKVYFHIAEKYYIPEAHWSSPDYIEKLRENLEKSRYTFINEPAPDFELIGVPEEHFHLAQMDTAIKRDPYVGYNFTLYNIQAKFTILYFWEADCGHCKKATPALYDVFTKYSDDVQVLAVHVINSVEGKEKWVDFVNEHELYGWINCWSPFSNEFRKQYNLNSFPRMFILDEEKKIIAKDISAEQADQILERFLN